MRRLKLFSFLILLVTNFLSIPAFANSEPEQGKPLITNYTEHDYNGYSANWAIVQDHRGVMYFGMEMTSVMDMEFWNMMVFPGI